MKYTAFDLGSGLHIALKECEETLVPNLAVVHNSLGKINPPVNKDFDVWEKQWEGCKQAAKDIVGYLNSGSISESQATEIINELNGEQYE